MDIKYTKKAMRENHTRIISLGYCEAQHLLRYQERIGYSAGASGWDCDYYRIPTKENIPALISTGYRPLSAKRTKAPYDSVERYDNKARDIISDSNIPLEEKRYKVDRLLFQFVDEALEV